MKELAPVLFMALVGFGLALMQAQRFDRATTRLLLLSYVAHLACAPAQVWMTKYFWGSGDLLGYTAMGDILATLLRYDFAQFMPELLKVLIHEPAVIPVEIPGQGSSTGSMGALSGLVTFVTGGGTYTLCTFVAIGAYFGQVALFQAFRNSFPAVYHRRLLVSALLVPSEIFWSSGFLKEGVAILGLGYVVLGVEGLVRKGEPLSIPMIVCGAPLIGLFKPYILAGIIAGTAGLIFFRSAARRDRSTALPVILGTVVALGGSVALIHVFPNYSIDRLTEQAAFYQQVGPTMDGGSNYSLGDLGPVGESSLAVQLLYAPFALLTSLFRPVLVEVRSPQVFVNSIETTTVLVFLVRALTYRRLGQTWALFKQMPMLAFSLAFVLVFGIGVGFTTTNLGTLSRYRMPLVPFLWALTLVLGARLESKQPKPAPAALVQRRAGARRAAVVQHT